MTLPDLLPHQATGAAFLASGPRVRGLFDLPGLGKTRQALEALRAVPAAVARGAVVVCPAGVGQVWEREAEQWIGARAEFVTSRKQAASWAANRCRRGVIGVFGYERATADRELIRLAEPGVLVLDESHYVKSDRAQRTRAAIGERCDLERSARGNGGIGESCAHVWFLTGTPAPGGAIDTHTFLTAAGEFRGSRDAFRARFWRPDGPPGSWTLQPSGADWIRAALARHAIRRTPESAGLSLPPLAVRPLSLAPDMTAIREFEAEHPGISELAFEAFQAAARRTQDDGGPAVSLISAPAIATLRRLTAEAKAPALAAHILERLRAGLDSAVAFGIHTDAIAALVEALEAGGAPCAVVTGQTPPGEARQEQVRRFLEGEARVFVGNMHAAGTGLTLTRAREVFVLEPDWTPATNDQAIKRIHRIGQLRPCKAWFAAARGTVDERVATVLARKISESAAVGAA